MYSDSQLKTARAVVLAAWIFGLLAYFPPLAEMAIGGLGRALFGILFSVHLIEFRTRNFSPRSRRLVSLAAKGLSWLAKLPGFEARRGRFQFLAARKGA